jgi:hypothetical protein
MKTAELKSMLAGAIAALPALKYRTEILKACQWRLRGPNGEYVGLTKQLACAFVPEADALVFDGRDNEDMKLATYQAALGELTIEIIPQTK